VCGVYSPPMPVLRTSSSALVARPAVAPDVSVVVVTYNVREFLEQALESVRRASAGLGVEVFVVDNDSADGTAAMVRSRFPEVRFIENHENVGFAVANNQAIREAHGRHVLLLNPDTLVQEDTLRTLVAFMDAHPEAGAVGPRMLNPDGTFAPESRRAFPTPAVAFYRMTGLSRLFPGSPVFGRYNLTYLPKNEVCEVDALSGACMMVRREAIWGQDDRGPQTADRRSEAGLSPTPPSSHPTAAEGAGLLDEGFFMYGEDLDWCYRIQQAGWRIYYTPATQLIHYKGESTRKGELRYVRLFYGAMLRFAEKHFSGETEHHPLRRLGLRALAVGIRLAILLRGAVSAAARLGRSARAPVTDLLLAVAAFALAEVIRDGSPDAAALIFAAGLGVAAVVGVAGAGGYAHGARRLRPVLLGLAATLVAVAAAAYFIPALVLARRALVGGTALTAVALLLRRLLTGRPITGPHRTLVVGDAAEAARLDRLAAALPRPPLRVIGRVGDDEPEGAVPLLGPTRQLRDLVRLHGADDVVFAAESLTNTSILGWMRLLNDLPVGLRILVAGHDRVIGKASVEDFSVPLRAARTAVARPAPTAGQRALAVAVGTLGVLLGPLLRALARRRPTPRRTRLAAAAAQMRDVLAGRRALVGYSEAAPRPPREWGIEPGAVSILDALPAPPVGIPEAHRAYWFYAANRSAALDAEIVWRALARA